jgi:hypothetical protein
MSEDRVKRAVKKLCDSYGEDLVQYLMPVGGPYGTSGVSDFIITAPGLVIFCETKAKGNKITPLQRVFLEKKQRVPGSMSLVITGEQEVNTHLRPVLELAIAPHVDAWLKEALPPEVAAI